MTGYDVLEHHRRRTRRAEARADGLAAELDRTIRILALCATIAADGRCHPATLVQTLHDLDEQARQPPTDDQLVRLLRDTNPDRIRPAAAA